MIYSTDDRPSGAALPTFEPLSVGDLFDGGFRIFRRNLAVLVRLGLISAVPLAIFQFIVQLTGPAMEGGEAGGVAMLVFVLVITFLAVIVASVLSGGALISAISEAILGRVPTVPLSVSMAILRFSPLLGGLLIYGLAVVLLSVTVLGIPVAIYLAINWAFFSQVVLIERLGVMMSFARSRELVRGFWWRTLGIAVLWQLLILIVTLVLSIPVYLLSFASQGASGSEPGVAFLLIENIWGAGVNAITIALSYCAYVLYYYDLRVRKEAFDTR